MIRLGLCLLLLISAQVSADARDDFPSCYTVLDKPRQAQASARELIVIIDQTVKLNVALKRHVHATVNGFLQPGDRFTLLTFSAYAQSHYASMPLSGATDVPLDEDTRYHTSLTSLRKFDRCMARQGKMVRRSIDQAIKTALDGADDSLPRTEVAASLAEFGDSVIAVSTAPRRVVLLVSDMLENSATASFYRNGELAELEVEAALTTTASAGALSNWREAEIYIIGAAYSPDGVYRTRPVLDSLRQFWTAYLEKSNARLLGWGQPELLAQIP
ncbi:hypothetical protein [Allohahella marinimesophila]|uniref:VWFA domain-containing protein n=1 Tax=Allohahella marinimesophila TaxID=1054972 RepID=A0ABP7NLB1_9GAMM